MRARGIMIALCGVFVGCAVNLHRDDDNTTSAVAPPPALSGCLPLSDAADAVTGRVARVALSGQNSLVIAANATVAGTTASTAFADAGGDCFSDASALPARPVIDSSALGNDLSPRPMAAISAEQATFLFFAAEHAGLLASDGFGVARFDASTQRFVARALLWTADRPSFGSAAAVVADEVYVFGGLSARYLAADVYLARVPLTQIEVPSAYEYWLGGGSFGPDPDRAAPVFEGGTAPTLAFDSAHARWLVLYTTPLAVDVTARSGLDIAGPWSAPYLLGRCELPSDDPGSFCGDLALEPELAGPGEIAFTQAVTTFSRPSRTTARDYWTRLVRTPWPSELP